MVGDLNVRLNIISKKSAKECKMPEIIQKKELKKRNLNTSCPNCGMDFTVLPESEELTVLNIVAYCSVCAAEVSRSQQ